MKFERMVKGETGHIYTKTVKVASCFLILPALFLYIFPIILYIFANRLPQEETDEHVVLKNVVLNFILLRDQGEDYVTYKIRFKDSISAVNMISSIEQVIDFCADEEKNNRYKIWFRNTENLNHLFFEYYNKDEEYFSQLSKDKLCEMYQNFLQKHLFTNGSAFKNSVFIAMPDFKCFTDNGKFELFTDFCIYFNWGKVQ